VALLCSGASCAGSLQLQGPGASRELYGKLNFSLAAGTQAILALRLTPAGVQLLRRTLHVSAWASVRLRDARVPAERTQIALVRVLSVVNRWHAGFDKFWSGYALTGQKFRAVRGTFVQPTMASCSGSSARSPEAPVVNNVFIWSGLDGLGSAPIEQVGTEVDCAVAAGLPPAIGYFAWYETFPDHLHAVPVAIHPGDTIATEVKAVGSQRFAMTLEDRTTAARWSEVVYQHARAPLTSAEWIDEAQGITMPTITTTSWSSVSTTARGSTTPIGGSPGSQLTALSTTDRSSNQQIQPGPLSATGDAFSVSWLVGAS